jgi:predicted metal-dependent hydrolase
LSRDLHPTLDAAERRDFLREGVRLFRSARFFEAHEAFEEVWRSTTPEPKDLWQGIIQVAAGMHHFVDRSRPDVAARVLGKGRRRLEAYPDVVCGLAVAELVARVQQWEVWLGSTAGKAPPLPDLRVVADEELR